MKRFNGLSWAQYERDKICEICKTGEAMVEDILRRSLLKNGFLKFTVKGTCVEGEWFHTWRRAMMGNMCEGCSKYERPV